ncbi:N-acetylneuraminic acid phosphatase [Columba livia]|uniref:N-acetylneuraminic acid phosphatase n=1 Tax=Columba livia TaxID=8932 RepID=A0A2I0LYA0_COLLI|nr:N-acetylneuraminic acid phosphatase [Columba livia]
MNCLSLVCVLLPLTNASSRNAPQYKTYGLWHLRAPRSDTVTRAFRRGDNRLHQWREPCTAARRQRAPGRAPGRRRERSCRENRGGRRATIPGWKRCVWRKSSHGSRGSSKGPLTVAALGAGGRGARHCVQRADGGPLSAQVINALQSKHHYGEGEARLICDKVQAKLLKECHDPAKMCITDLRISHWEEAIQETMGGEANRDLAAECYFLWKTTRLQHLTLAEDTRDMLTELRKGLRLQADAAGEDRGVRLPALLRCHRCGRRAERREAGAIHISLLLRSPGGAARGVRYGRGLSRYRYSRRPECWFESNCLVKQSNDNPSRYLPSTSLYYFFCSGSSSSFTEDGAQN